jgi:hypothetical protein
MGTVHDIIEAHGRQGALGFDLDRAVVDAAAGYMSDEDSGIGYLYSGWCQAALPHKRLPDDQGWQVKGGQDTEVRFTHARPERDANYAASKESARRSGLSWPGWGWSGLSQE